MFVTRVPGIHPLQVEGRMARGWLALDVRPRTDWDTGHIEESRPMTLGEIVTRLNSVGDKVICVCAHGERSWRVTRYLTLQGIDAYDLTGGMESWAAAGLPIAV